MGKEKKATGQPTVKKEPFLKETLDASADVSTGGMLCNCIFLHTDDRSNPCI